MKKLLLTVWVGPSVGCVEASGDLQGEGRANSVSQFDGVSDVVPTCQLCGFVGWGLRKGTMASAHICACEKLPPWCQTLQFLSVYHWCLSSYYPDTGAQREWVWVSPCVGSFLFFSFLFFKILLFIFRERGREKKGEKHVRWISFFSYNNYILHLIS